MTRAYSYLRFSTPEQERGDSFRRQTSMAEAYAARHGLQLDERSFQDLGVSAYRGANAETGMLGEFLDLVRSEAIPKGSFLLVESLDRLSRNKPRKAVRLLESICEEGITLVTLADGKLYDEKTLDDDPMAFMWAFMVAIRANEESAMKSRRLKAAWEAKRSKAREKPLTARAPYWLRLNHSTGNFEEHEARANVVRRIFEMTLQGIGQHRIAETLNAERVPVFGSGRHWHRSYIAKLLGNPAVIGTCVPHTVEYDGGRKLRRPGASVEGYFPAVVDRETFEHVQAMARGVRSPLRGRHAMTGTVSNLFGGIARCPLCDGTMTRVSKGKRQRAYLVCTNAKAGGGCRYRTVPYERLEEAFLANGARVIATAPAGDAGAHIDEEIANTEGGIEGAETGIENIMENIERGRSTIAERDRLRELEDQREQMKRELDDLLRQRWEMASPMVSKRLDALDAALSAPAIDRRHVNALLRQLFKAAVVDYRTGQLLLQWKHGGESDVSFGWGEDTYWDEQQRA
jgi:DNA invertase Pin-like site-specific DNA recombinase